MKPPQAPPHIQRLTPYQPGRTVEEIRARLGLERIIKLASNENPLGPSPKALARMREVQADLSLYPTGGLALRKALAARLGVGVEKIAAGSGSEGILAAAMRAYLQPGDEVITAEGTFIGFYVLSHAQNLSLKTVPLKDYTFDLEAILEAAGPRTKLIYLANPNNPTGTAFGREEYARFLAALPGGVLVVMDEAYYEYACEWEDYPDSLEAPHDQVLTLRTFSKAYGLAGVRIGYGVAHEEIISNILKVKLPFEPSSSAEAAGLGALEDSRFLALTRETNRRGMQRLCDALDRLGLPHPPSRANFILVPMESPERAEWFSHELLVRGIIARPMVPFRLPHAVRITVGDEEQTTTLIEALEEIFPAHPAS